MLYKYGCQAECTKESMYINRKLMENVKKKKQNGILGEEIYVI